MNRYKTLIKNTFLVSIGTFGSKLLPFLLIRLYTYVLQDGEYNTADIITQTAKLLIPLAAVGLTEGLFRLAMEGDDLHKKKVFTAGFLIFGGGYLILVPLLLLAYGIMVSKDVAFSKYMWLIGLYVLMSCLHSLATEYIRTRDHYGFFSLQGVINTFLVAFFNVIFLYFNDFGVEGYVSSVILADFLVFLLCFFKEKLWKDFVPPKSIEKSVFKNMIAYSAPLIPMAVSWWVTAVSDRYMVRFFVENPNIADHYSAAYKIPTLVTLLCTVFSQAWSYSSVKEEDEKERSAFFSSVFSFYFSLLFVMASGIILFSKVFTRIMMDPSYYASWSYIPLLSAATVYSSLVTFMGSVYTVRKKSTFSMWTALVGAILNILLNLVLIPESLFGIPMGGMGAMGAALATLISYMVVFLLRAFTAKHYVQFNMQPKLLLLNTVLLLVQVGIMTYSDKMNTALWISLEILLFLLIFLADLKVIYERVKRKIRRK